MWIQNLFKVTLVSCVVAGVGYVCYRGYVFNTHPIEGSNCTSHGVSGTCAKRHTCATLIVDQLGPAKRMPELCSADKNNPIVCCTSCFKMDNISNAVVANSGILFTRTNSKVWNKCLDYSKYTGTRCRIEGSVYKTFNKKSKCYEFNISIQTAIGGMDASRGTYTHVGLLGYGPIENMQWLCGGSLISEKFILTAGHCIGSSSTGPVTQVALGMLRRSDPEYLGQKYKARRMILHPEYKPPSKYNDIALVETETPVRFNLAASPACLPDVEGVDIDDTDEDEEVATAIGLGAMGREPIMADVLQVINVERFKHSKCWKQYGLSHTMEYGVNVSTQMCYGDTTRAIDTCEGDSGGPLQVEIRRLCMYKLIGVTSSGRECGRRGQAGIYTRVRHFVPWIESVVWP